MKNEVIKLADNNFANFASAFSENENAKPIFDLVEQIMNIPDEQLNEFSIKAIKGMINSLNETIITPEAIKEMIKGFELQGLNKTQAGRVALSMKEGINELIEELNPTEYKRELLNSIFEIIYNLFDAALEQYHSYDIELPILLEEGARMPTYAHETDAAADIYALEDMTIPAHSRSNMVHTGIRIALPENWAFLIDPRSSIGLNSGLRLSNSLGLVDEDYRGEICVLYDNISDSDYEIKAGDRIAQCWVHQVHRFKPIAVNELPATERGENGFGSTGK